MSRNGKSVKKSDNNVAFVLAILQGGFFFRQDRGNVVWRQRGTPTQTQTPMQQAYTTPSVHTASLTRSEILEFCAQTA